MGESQDSLKPNPTSLSRIRFVQNQYFSICSLYFHLVSRRPNKNPSMLSPTTSTLLRNLFPRPLLPYTGRALRTALLRPYPKPTSWLPFSSSLKSFSVHSSASNLKISEYQNEKLVFQDDLVVLGIETSCDDTAAAVVSSYSPFFLYFSF